MMKLINILEDDLAIRELCTYLLNEEGYQVQGFENVESFSANQSVPNLFLLDVQLPDGNGLEVCDKLKSDPKFFGVPVIMMSAHLAGPKMLIGSKADGFIEKPFDINLFIDRISQLAK